MNTLNSAKTPSSSFSKHPIVATVIGGAVLAISGWVLNHYYQLHEQQVMHGHDLYEAISALSADIGSSDIADFNRRALSFKQNMQEDAYSRRYSNHFMHPFRSRENAIADLVGVAEASIDTYLSRCSGKQAIYDQKQMDSDCQLELVSYVSTALQRLSDQLYQDEIN